eukprot:TRINITY_DN32853_c0_g2_i1.p1 TRINITY_DN32853_c0_g2~~TRINITY_DN32853_c0_g2_i1.p1  ORF type:complete len:571 (-),score=46.74 TRINITY_DN32853_c0_g2_i1:150-1748(-)
MASVAGLAGRPSPCAHNSYARWLRQRDGSYRWTPYTCAAMMTAMMASRRAAAARRGSSRSRTTRQLSSTVRARRLLAEDADDSGGQDVKGTTCEDMGEFACETKKQMLRSLLLSLGPHLSSQERQATETTVTHPSARASTLPATSGESLNVVTSIAMVGDSHMRNLFLHLTYTLLHNEREKGGGIGGQQHLHLNKSIHSHMCALVSRAGDIRPCPNGMQSLVESFEDELANELPARQQELEPMQWVQLTYYWVDGIFRNGEDGCSSRGKFSGRTEDFPTIDPIPDILVANSHVVSRAGDIRPCPNGMQSLVESFEDELANELPARQQELEPMQWVQLTYYWVDGIFRNGEDGCSSRGKFSGRTEDFPTIDPIPDILVANSGHWTMAKCSKPEKAWARSLPHYIDWLLLVASSQGYSNGSRNSGNSSQPATASVKATMFLSAPPYPTGMNYDNCAGRTNAKLAFANEVARTLVEKEGIKYLDLWPVVAPRYLNSCGYYNPHYSCEHADSVDGFVGTAVMESFIWELQQLLIPT